MGGWADESGRIIGRKYPWLQTHSVWDLPQWGGDKTDAADSIIWPGWLQPGRLVLEGQRVGEKDGR